MSAARGAALEAPPETARAGAKPRVWIVGPAPWSRGGVAAVTRLLCSSSLAARYEITAVATHVAGGWVERAAWAVRGEARVGVGLALSPPDLVHIQLASRGSFYRKLAVAAMCRARGVPTAVHVHGGGFDAFLRSSPPWVRRAARWLIEGADAAATLSEARRAALAPLFSGVEWAVVPNPVEARALAPIAEERAARALPGRAATRLLFLGDVRERKGVGDLLRAMASLVPRWPALRLALAGPGEIERSRLTAGELGVAERVEFHGWVAEERKRVLLRESDLFVLPSHVEGVPLALLEAMACGLPSVVTPVGGVLDAALPDETSLVVPPRDPAALAAAIERLVADADLRRRLGERARARALDFDVATVAERVDALYRRALARGARQAGAAP